MTISDNFIDWTTNPNSVFYTNNCIRITSELGNVGNVTVTGNYLIGGSAVIDAGNAGSGSFSNISITNNYLGFGTYDDCVSRPDVRRDDEQQRHLRLHQPRLFHQRLGGLPGGRAADAEPPRVDQRLHHQGPNGDRPDDPLRQSLRGPLRRK